MVHYLRPSQRAKVVEILRRFITFSSLEIFVSQDLFFLAKISFYKSCSQLKWTTGTAVCTEKNISKIYNKLQLRTDQRRYQCDQMTRLYVQYLAIYNTKNLPNTQTNLPKLV